MKYGLKSVSGLSDAWVAHDDRDSPQSSTQMFRGIRKIFKMTDVTMPNNIYYTFYKICLKIGPWPC